MTDDEPVDFDMERIKESIASKRYRLPDRELTLEEIHYYLTHPEECEEVKND